MLKTLVLTAILLSTFSAFSQPEKKALACSYSEKFYGVWMLDDIVIDLSGENAEEEGQGWEITSQEIQDVKGKMKFTFSPDATCSATIVETTEDEAEYSYGYWKSAADCKEITMSIEGEDMPFGVIAVDGSRLVLESKDWENEGTPPMKLVFLKRK